MDATLNGFPVYDGTCIDHDALELVRSSGGAVFIEKGRSAVLVLDISGDDSEAVIRAVRRARASAAFESMRRTAEQNGWMSDEEIEAEVASSRQERRGL